MEEYVKKLVLVWGTLPIFMGGGGKKQNLQWCIWDFLNKIDVQDMPTNIREIVTDMSILICSS